MAALSPHLGVKVGTGLYAASLNHALWFHAPVQADDWLLVEAQAASTSQARGLTQGKVWNRHGTLVASIAQESLFRGWVEQDGTLTAPYRLSQAGDAALSLKPRRG